MAGLIVRFLVVVVCQLCVVVDAHVFGLAFGVGPASRQGWLEMPLTVNTVKSRHHLKAVLSFFFGSLRLLSHGRLSMAGVLMKQSR